MMLRRDNKGDQHMKRALIPLALAAALSTATAADQPQGGSWKDVKAEHVTVYATGGPGGEGYAVYTLSTNSTGTPQCASGYPRNVVVDIGKRVGAMAASELEKSMLMGGLLTATGTGTCFNGSEVLASISSQSRG